MEAPSWLLNPSLALARKRRPAHEGILSVFFGSTRISLQVNSDRDQISEVKIQ